MVTSWGSVVNYKGQISIHGWTSRTARVKWSQDWPEPATDQTEQDGTKRKGLRYVEEKEEDADRLIDRYQARSCGASKWKESSRVDGRRMWSSK
jgi:hypothetical protein